MRQERILSYETGGECVTRQERTLSYEIGGDGVQ
jgi:hypothetical protein